ncbi:MAG: hypothetical protein M1813_003715 [Trichoglossum hirsutum]|nr:MAG: hypothetical protein M1813_003715 [Trichoglossum hirsutum]
MSLPTTSSPAHNPLTPTSIIAITLSISIVVFVLLSLSIILCLRSRQKYPIDAYRRTNSDARPAQYAGGQAQTADQGRGDAPQGIALGEKMNSLSSYTLTRPPKSSRKGGPPSWNGSLEWHHDPLMEHTADGEGVAAATVPETTAGALGMQPSRPVSRMRPPKRGATFPVAQFNRTDPLLTPITENPVPRPASSPLSRSKTTGATNHRGTPLPTLTVQHQHGSPGTDKASITEWPSRALESLPDSPEKPNRAKGSHTRRRSRSSGDYQSLASIINLAIKGPAAGSNDNSKDQRLQNNPPALEMHSRSPGLAPDSPVPPLPVKTSDHNSHRYRDIFTARGKSFLSRKSVPLPRCPESFSSLQTTSSSILETAKYTASGQPDIIATPHSYPPPSSPPNFASSPLSSHTSSGPSIFDSLAVDWGTPPAAGLTSPSAVRLHRKQLSYGASQNGIGRGSSGLRQSVSCGARMLRGGSLTSLVTLGRPGMEGEKEGDGFRYSSSPPGGGVLLNSSSGNSNNGRSSSSEVDTPPRVVPTSPATPSRRPNGPLNQNHPSHFALPSSTSTPELPPHPWIASTNPTNNNSDPCSLFHWNPWASPERPRQLPPTKKGHRRQNCIRINYNPMELSTPQHRTLLSPIASVSDHPPASTPRPPSPTMIFSPPAMEEHMATEMKLGSPFETPQLKTTQSERDLRDSPTLAMVNYYSCPPSPIHDDDDDDGFSVSRVSDIFTAIDNETTPPQLKSLREPSPPPEHRTFIPFSPSPVPQKQQQRQHLRFSVLALRRMNPDISTATSRAGEVTPYLNLGGFSASVGTPRATGAASIARTRTIDDLQESSPESQGEPPRKIARTHSGIAAAAEGRRRRTVGGWERGERVEGVVGLGVDGILV